MSALISVAERAEALGTEALRRVEHASMSDCSSKIIGLSGLTGEMRTHCEPLNSEYVSNTVLYISNELFGVSKNVQMTRSDAQSFVDDIAACIGESAGLVAAVDSTEARDLIQSRLDQQQSDALSLRQDSNNMMRDTRLQQASLQAVKLLSSFSKMNGRLYRHQIEDVVLGLSDIITDYIDPDYDGSPQAVIDDLTQKYFFDKLPYPKHRGASLVQQGGSLRSAESLGRISLSNQPLKSRLYV